MSLIMNLLQKEQTYNCLTVKFVSIGDRILKDSQHSALPENALYDYCVLQK